MKNYNNIITIGIPTYEAGESLVPTLAAIYKQRKFDTLVKEILLFVDGNQISQQIAQKIRHPKLKIIIGKERKGQSGRINDICKQTETALLVLTNDDVIWDEYALETIISTYKQSSADLITTDVTPMRPTNMLQSIIYTGYTLTHEVSIKWNNRNNYLACNGRLLCLAKKLYKQMTIQETIWNNDAFIYLFAKTHNYIIAHATDAFCYYLLPQTLDEHSKQSTKFKASFYENQAYFGKSIKRFYEVPIQLVISTITAQAIKKPLHLLAYLGIYFMTELIPTDRKKRTQGFWQTDKTTKNIGKKIL